MDAPALIPLRPASQHPQRRRTLGPRYPNPRRVKIHHNYTVEEAAVLLDKHKHTIRAWITRGLPVCKDMRPYLILGPDLRAFLETKRAQSKRRCKPGEMYCLRCRAPKLPAGGMVDYHPQTDTHGNLKALCQDCFTPMNQRTSRAKLEGFWGILDIRFPQAQRRLVETA